jgi:DNA-binding transcriptional regulator GbsR (MarR family)
MTIRSKILAYIAIEKSVCRADILRHLKLPTKYRISTKLSELCDEGILSKTKKYKPGTKHLVYYFSPGDLFERRK